jgi:hypothetical protein
LIDVAPATRLAAATLAQPGRAAPRPLQVAPPPALGGVSLWLPIGNATQPRLPCCDMAAHTLWPSVGLGASGLIFRSCWRTEKETLDWSLEKATSLHFCKKIRDKIRESSDWFISRMLDGLAVSKMPANQHDCGDSTPICSCPDLALHLRPSGSWAWSPNIVSLSSYFFKLICFCSV